MGDFLKHLRNVNANRLTAWEADQKADGLFHSTELGGEVGEVLNVVKKLHREAMGWRGSRASLTDLDEEIGDVMICLDKLAAYYGIDIAAATVRKFNATSDKQGFPHKLALSFAGEDVRCAHCGRFEPDALARGSTHCNPPFAVQPHDFTAREALPNVLDEGEGK